MRNSRILFTILFVIVAGIARQAAAIPTDELLNSLKATGDVNDFANVLSPAEKTALEERCRSLQRQTGAQLAVVTLKSLDGGEIDEFAEKLFAHWGIGQKDKKNGLLLLVVMDEHKFRIEVGYGLEPIIPDLLAGRIEDQELRPRFRQGKYAEGLSAAVNALYELVEKGEPADRDALAAQDPNAQGGAALVIMFLTIFVVVGSLIAGIGFGSRTVQLILFGLLFAAFPLAIGMATSWPLAPLLQIPISLITVGVGYYLARQSANMSRRGPTSGSSSTGGTNWNWGNFGGASGGSWGSGGGGFSQDWGGFGGGSSGGGGASGGW